MSFQLIKHRCFKKLLVYIPKSECILMLESTRE